ncbi:MAG: TolC family protein [Acidobacteriota bacterium]|nr:TolC family protein [Acidobacteriota bacterium]
MSVPRLFRTAVERVCAGGFAFAVFLTAPAAADSAVAPILDHLAEPELRALVDEVLARNPRVAAAEARARAAEQRAPQVKALPDPTVGVTAFVLTPETRVGPQEMTLTASQALPWRAKLTTRAAAADLEAAALAAEADAIRLELVTEVRVQLLELAFVERLAVIHQSIRDHFAQHEQIARARYATGSGPGQGVIQLQAAITGVDHQLLELDSRRLVLRAEINALRDRRPSAPLPALTPPTPEPPSLDAERLVELALAARPDLRAARRRIERADSLSDLAGLARRPDFMVGVTYTLVGTRDDAPGRLQPPPGNGDDILGLQATVAVPLWRGRIAAGIEEAAAAGQQSEEERRVLAARLERDVSELAAQIPIRWRQLGLIREVLVVQAQEALDSATSGYVAGALNALDLLDAEHVLFDAQAAVARAETDYLVARARLEGALGLTLAALDPSETL